MNESVNINSVSEKPNKDISERVRQLIAVGVLTTAPFLSGCGKEDDPGVVKDKSSVTEVTPQIQELSQAEFYEIWNNKLQDLRSLLESHQSRYPEIAERYNNLLAQVKIRYGKDVAITIATNYNPRNRNIIAGSEVTAEGPEFGIFVPALGGIYKEKESEHREGWQEEFQNLTIISAMHELDHLASGYVLSPQDQDTSFDGRINREKHAWAETCEFTIEPLVKSGARIEFSDMLRYRAWVASGRDVNSKAWDASIRDIHKSIK